MILRRNILPKTIKDFLCSIFVVLIIPVIYYFELFIVMPTYYEMWSMWYNFHFICGNYVAFNVITNFVITVLVDTSVKGRLMSTELKSGWRFCYECESIVPPRSWHCDICKTCILKRDHHCVFTACCVGHENYKYFMLFIIYTFFATVYSMYFNTWFICQQVDFTNKMTILKMIFPLAVLVFDNSITQIYLLLYLVVMLGMVFLGVLLWYHMSLILTAQTTHERNFDLKDYNFGLKRNVEIVFGVKWYFTWISPFVTSEMPHDGINWVTKETIKNK